MDLRDMRLEKGLNINEVAEKCDITAGYVSKIERGICNPNNISFGILIGLSRLYNIEIMQLYDKMYKDHIKFLQNNIDEILNNKENQIFIFD